MASKLISWVVWFCFKICMQYFKINLFVCCCSVTKSCPTLWNPMECSTPNSSVLPWSLLKFMFIESVMLSNHLILCHPLLLLPSIFPSIRIFSNESALHIRWPKHWSFSFSISPSNEYLGLIFLFPYGNLHGSPQLQHLVLYFHKLDQF